MVFESVLAEVLNVYIGDYVENLDRSQLKIGIWGGDIVLQNLVLKQSVLDELHLPLKTVFGHLGKLILKIPWKNLYNAPVVASVERLFLLVLPNVEGQDLFLSRMKQAELQRLEIAKKFKKETARTKSSDTFVEKLATQIIRNVQVKIRDIHIRYEDELACPERPFSIGITLHNLSVQTTNQNWKEGIVQDAGTMIYKILNLEGLAVYMNCNAHMFMHENDPVERLRLFEKGISTKVHHAEGFEYVLGPINSSAKLQLNPRPEDDGSGYNIPKVLLILVMEQLAIGISRAQYCNFVALMEFFNKLNMMSSFRKNRPKVPRCKGYYKEWWKFAVKCVLEQRGYVSQVIDWHSVLKHRTMCRKYATAYRKKLQDPPEAAHIQHILEECEEALDVFNIMLVRQQVEAEMEWLERQNKQDAKPQAKSSWFGRWFGSGSSKDQENLAVKFREELSEDERLKLYQAIDYQENALPTYYPAEFVETKIYFRLNGLTVDVRDNDRHPAHVLLAELIGVSSEIQRRPTANAIKVMLSMGQLTVSGTRQVNITPQLISSRTQDSENSVLVNILFETNPLGGAYDQRLRMHALPLQLTYDAYTVNRIVEVFQMPESSVIAQLQAMAESRLSALKEMSAVGLQRAIEQHTVTDIEIDLMSSYVLLPHRGFYRGKEDLLVANLGRLSVVTVPRDVSLRNTVDHLHKQGLSGEYIMQTMRDKSYDQFLVELKDVQVLMVLAGEDWEKVLRQPDSSAMHLLEPASLTVSVEKCLVKHDPTLPNLKIVGRLPSITFTVEENRLVSLMTLYHSVPFPNLNSNSQDNGIRLQSDSLLISDENEAGEDQTLSQTTEVDLKFELGGLKLLMYKPCTYSQGQFSGPVELQKIIDFCALHLEMRAIKRTFDTTMTIRLGGVVLKYNGPEGTLTLLDPSTSSGQSQDMLSVKYRNVDEKSPDFVTKYGSVHQLVKADFNHLSVLLHQEALLALYEYINGVSQQLEKSFRTSLAEKRQEGEPVHHHKSKRSIWQGGVGNSVQLQMKACMHELSISLILRQQLVARFLVEGLEAVTSVTKPCTEIIARLRNLSILGPSCKSPHHKILSIVGNEALSTEIVFYNHEKGKQKNAIDMSIKAQMACSRIVFLNSFISSVTDFFSTFHEAQENLSLAMAEAAQAARQSVLKAHAKAKFIQLDISLQAPLIVVPISTASLDAMHLDFGRLIIRNKFMMLSSEGKNQNPAVDSIQLDLQNLQLSRVTLTPTADVLSEHKLVPPISFLLQMTRNLSVSWYTQIPDISMVGRLENAELSLGLDDVRMIMRILSENLAESTSSSGAVAQHAKSISEGTKKSNSCSESPNGSLSRSISWTLKLNMSHLKVILGLKEGRVADFIVRGFDVIFSKNMNLEMAFRIKDVIVRDLSSSTAHQKILAVEGGEALSADLLMYDRKSQMEGIDMALRAQMARIRVIFLIGFFSSMIEFLNTFQEVPGDLADAVAEAAKQGVLQAHSAAKRISLNVDLKAPVIIIPAHQRSSDALLMDFGNLTLKNKFLSVSDSATGENAVVDELNIGLHNLKISRVKLNHTGEILSECWLLQPVDFFLQVKRNLCAGQYQGMPDVEVKGHIRSVVVAGNQDDIKMALSIVSQNLSSSSGTIHKARSDTVSNAPSRGSKKSANPPSFGVNIPVQFTFTMDSLVVELFEEDSAKVENLSCVHLLENSLARFTLCLFALKGMQYFDGSVDTTVLLVDCWLDDTRKNSKSRLSRLMERKTDSSKTTAVHGGDIFAPFHVPKNVEIVYKKKEFQTEVNIRIFSFNLILNVEYLTKLSRFLTAALHSNEELGSHVRFQPQQGDNLMLTTGTSVDPGDSVMIINLHAEKPDIFLVEDMEDLNTSALVLRSEISCSLYHGNDAVNVKGFVKELQLYSCCYNPDHRKETMSQILLPCSVQVEGFTSQLDVSFSNIRLRVSPGTIELLTRVMRAVYSRESGTGGNGDCSVDHSDLWIRRSVQELDHWFLRKDGEKDVTELTKASFKQIPSRSEICILQAPSVTVTIEAGVGSHTLPMILLNAGLNATIHDWSSQLSMNCSLSLQMANYNSYLAVWEPLLEPVETIKNDRVIQIPWELTLTVDMSKQQQQQQQQQASLEALGDWEYIPSEPSTMEINISSKDSLELVVTKTGLDVLSNLVKAFQTAMDGGLMSIEGPASPYVVYNHIGLPTTLLLAQGPFRVHGSRALSQDCHTLAPGECVGLCVVNGSSSSPLSLLNLGHADEKFLKILIPKLDCVVDLPVVQANTRYFSLHDSCGLVSDVRIECGRTIVTLRSIVQVYNYLGVPIDVYCMTKVGRGAENSYVGTVAPAEHLDLPFYAVYTPTNELLFSIPGFSAISYRWTEVINTPDSLHLYECVPEQSSYKEPYYLRIMGSVDQAYFETSNTKVMASSFYKLQIKPAVVIKNLLPVSITCFQPGTTISKVLRAGEQLQFATAKPGSSLVVFQILDYRQTEWKYSLKVSPSPPEFSVLQFKSSQNTLLGLGMQTERKHGSLVMSLYSPFWFLNKTGLPLSYWQSDESKEIPYHPNDVKNPVLFPSFSSNKKAAIRIGDGQWSEKFSIDVAGNSGVISCTTKGRSYKIGVHVHLMRATLIKQVTFTPYYVLINNTKFGIECQEADRPADPWFKVEPGNCSALWPYFPNESVGLRARVSGTVQLTPPFMCNTVHTTLLLLNNKYGGLNVDVQITEGAVYVTFTSYEPGQAPALIINYTWMMISISEIGSDNVWLINPGEEVLFTWSNPCGPRQLEWCPGVDKDVCKLCQDGSGSFYPIPNMLIHWSSFLDGLQRVLLFSSDRTVTQNLQDSRQVLQKVTMRIYGLGLSLVNNITRTELLYIGTRRKPTVLKAGSSKTSTNVVDMDVGLWLEAKIMPYEMQLHAKVHHLQIDNQLPDCTYPVALAPVPPPRTVAANNAMVKPFTEMSVIRRSMKHSSLQQFKYFKVLVQEFHIRMDMGLVNALFTMLEAGQVSDDVEAAQFLEDRSLVGAPLRAHVALHSSRGQKNFFDFLHFSPLMIHLSFSLCGGSRKKGQETPHALRVLLRSLGVTLTDVQDVVFKLAYFERRNTFLTYQQLVSEALQHYRGQALKQLYVLVLGLDVIGNPYGLVVGLTQGVEDFFYEPFRGAIQGPGEFAEGLMLGVKSLLGHTVGGAAGAMSRITGAMGKGVAALTFDEEYQRKRQETLSQRSTNVQTGLAQSGKGLVMGIADGVSGVFMKPISGAKKDGVEGFFKGVGKGVMGLVARPTAGIIDFASGSLDAVKRTTDTSIEVERQRPPRFFHRDGQVRPYIRAEAEGKKILEELDNRQIATSDCYECHFTVVPGKVILMLTDKRILYLTYVDMFGRWKIEWEHPWNALSGPPVTGSHGIFIHINRLGHGTGGREVPITNPEQQQLVVEKAKVLMKH
ncbi:intermembrane lipid transfer protein Vps13 [Anabrus simplex]|uniref:intermembrane lipid transfer protein Vps13 n=1 Tax=Anabrus simplex TaxID=316456 RepID=UPI0035A313DE